MLCCGREGCQAPTRARGLSGGVPGAGRGWGGEGRRGPQAAAAPAASEELGKPAEVGGAAGGQGQRVSKAALLGGRSWTVKQDEWLQTSEQRQVPKETKVVSLSGGGVLAWGGGRLQGLACGGTLTQQVQTCLPRAGEDSEQEPDSRGGGVREGLSVPQRSRGHSCVTLGKSFASSVLQFLL